MKQLIIILSLCAVFPLVSFAGSIEYERMQGSIRQEQEEKQKQAKKAVEEYNKMVDVANSQTDNTKKRPSLPNLPEGYWLNPRDGKIYSAEKIPEGYWLNPRNGKIYPIKENE